MVWVASISACWGYHIGGKEKSQGIFRRFIDCLQRMEKLAFLRGFYL